MPNICWTWGSAPCFYLYDDKWNVFLVLNCWLDKTNYYRTPLWALAVVTGVFHYFFILNGENIEWMNENELPCFCEIKMTLLPSDLWGCNILIYTMFTEETNIWHWSTKSIFDLFMRLQAEVNPLLSPVTEAHCSPLHISICPWTHRCISETLLWAHIPRRNHFSRLGDSFINLTPS